MTTLDSYLHGPYREDTDFRLRMLKSIDEVLPIFYKRSQDFKPDSADETWSTWPYAAQASPIPTPTPPLTGWSSASTHSMILFALDSFTPRKPELHSCLLGPGFRPCKLSGPLTNKDQLAAVVASAQACLRGQILKLNTGALTVQSGTYGTNDPFTLTWLVEQAIRLRERDLSVTADFSGLLKAAELALTRSTILDTPLNTPPDTSRFTEVTGSSFLKVRRLHLALTSRRLASGLRPPFDETGWLWKATLWSEFDSTLHRQLSYRAMGDPKFDPAEIAFAFEGALLLQPNWVGRSVVEQVFAALALEKGGKPFWRPVRPFLSNDRGQVLFLVSIEVANSILRSCEILDHGSLVPAQFAQIEPQLRTYANWVLGEAERIDAAGCETLVGWRSEYGEERGTIHLWHTSHVLLFLAHYVCFLKRKIGADGLEAAGLSVGSPKLIERFWEASEPLPGVSGKGGAYSVLARIHDHYITPRATGGAPNVHSVLLYGPPGTGKTTVAEQMASALGQKLVTVTVSDFLAAGTAELENRAKGVFEVLRSLERVVILFDEIDQFLLDRNSDFYQKQDDVFKFMTPGMLTKFQDLRDGRDCLFVIATNYFERIDSAIKRRGRVDDHLLLCLPNRKQRANLLQGFVKRSMKRLSSLPDIWSLPDGGKLLTSTVFFGWGDLKYLVESTAEADEADTKLDKLTEDTLCGALVVAAGNLQPAVNLAAYHQRFAGNGPYPYEEFFLLVHLAVESNAPLSDADQEFVAHVVMLSRLTQANYDSEMPSKYVKDNAVAAGLKPVLLPSPS